jgi:hypothetical protein
MHKKMTKTKTAEGKKIGGKMDMTGRLLCQVSHMKGWRKKKKKISYLIGRK